MKDMFIVDPVDIVCLRCDIDGPVSSREAA